MTLGCNQNETSLSPIVPLTWTRGRSFLPASGQRPDGNSDMKNVQPHRWVHTAVFGQEQAGGCGVGGEDGVWTAWLSLSWSLPPSWVGSEACRPNRFSHMTTLWALPGPLEAPAGLQLLLLGPFSSGLPPRPWLSGRPFHHWPSPVGSPFSLRQPSWDEKDSAWVQISLFPMSLPHHSWEWSYTPTHIPPLCWRPC